MDEVIIDPKQIEEIAIELMTYENMSKSEAISEVTLIAYAELTTKARKKLPSGEFVYPKEKRYPIHDRRHGANALSRVEQHGTPEEKAKVRAAVCRKYPDLPSCKKKKGEKND